MQEGERIDKYKKNNEQEERLKNLNFLLAPLEAQIIRSFSMPQKPVIFIFGVPRSGTTLLAQLLAATKGFGYISNFIARFWMAPYVGALLQQALNLKKMEDEISFKSEFGVTNGWLEPHEFGYFWARWFDYGDTHVISPSQLTKIDTKDLKREVAAVESVYQKPMFFKYIPSGCHLPFITETFDKALFIFCKRSPLYNAQSLLLARRKLFGDEKFWFSMRPKEYFKLSKRACHEQVVGQVYYLMKEMESGLSQLSPNRFLSIKYNELCEKPRKQIERIFQILEKNGEHANFNSDGRLPTSFQSSDCQMVDKEDFSSLIEACRKYFGNSYINE